MKIGNTRIDNKSAVLGALTAFALCVVPKVSDITSSIIGKIRGMIGGTAK